MKTVRGTALLTAGLASAMLSVVTGEMIDTATSVWEILFYVFAAVLMLCVSLVLCAFGLNIENEAADREAFQKIERISHHTNEWRDA